jgi:hypothetical protein
MSSIDLQIPEQQPVATQSVRAKRSTSTILLGVGRQVLIAFAFIGSAVLLRGWMLSQTVAFNPDEAELMAQARAAMRSPVPFTTWTTATTGPYLVLFLALLGALGLPLTIAFGHLVAAVLLGVMGYLGFTLAQRWLGWAMSAVLTVFWCLPIVLTLTGLLTNFAPLATELLPCALLLAAALPRTEALSRRPTLYLVTGLLCGLSIGSKYQAAPVAAALLVAQLILVGDFRRRVLLRNAALWAAGVVLPFVLVGLSMVLSPDLNTRAIRQNLNFLSGYSGGLTLEMRLSSWQTLVSPLHLVLLVLVVCWLGTRSRQRVQLCRLVLVGGGLVASFVGGMAFGHYLFFVYTGIVLAIGLPLKPKAQLVPYVPQRQRLVAAAVVGVVLLPAWLLAFGPSKGTFNLSSPHDLSIALSKDSAPRLASLVAACPAGSDVLVWGWAGEMYVNYGWRNAIPFFNVTQILWSPKNHTSGYEMARDAIADPATDCVLDAVGPPFFYLGQESSLTTVYPQLVGLLDEKYRKVPQALQCDICTVYVRR